MNKLKNIIKRLIKEQDEKEMNAKPVHPLKGTDKPTSRRRDPGDIGKEKDPLKGPKPPEPESCCAELGEADSRFAELYPIYQERNNFLSAIENLMIVEVQPIDSSLCMNAFENSAVVNPNCETEIAWYCSSGWGCTPSDYHAPGNSRLVFKDGSTATLEGASSQAFSNTMQGVVFGGLPDSISNLTVNSYPDVDFGEPPMSQGGELGFSINEIPGAANLAQSSWNGSNIHIDMNLVNFPHYQDGVKCAAMIHSCVNNLNYATYTYFNAIKPMVFDNIKYAISEAWETLLYYYEQECCAVDNYRTAPQSSPDLTPIEIPEPEGSGDDTYDIYGTTGEPS